MAEFKITPQSRRYDHEEKDEDQRLPLTNAKRHPLQPSYNRDDPSSPLKVKEEKEKDEDEGESFADPLGAHPLNDPLSGSGKSGAAVFDDSTVKLKKVKKFEDPALDWDITQKEVLAKYTTQVNIPIVSKIVDDVEREEEIVTLTERAKRRLETLEEDEDPSAVKHLSQKELVNHLEGLASELETAWNKQEKVKSLRIVIQSCKMLVNCKVPQVYPSLFVLVSKVLDTFGRLVFERIKKKSCDDKSGKRVLPENFTQKDIPPDAKEMCKNWFYKIASIRELLPRVYVEITLWPCNRFLIDDTRSYEEMMRRFVAQCRGLGDPLVAQFARFFLLRKALEVFDNGPPLPYVQQCLDDWLYTKKQWSGLGAYLKTYDLTLAQYENLYSPAVKWTLKCMGLQGDKQMLQDTVQKFIDNSPNCMMLNHIIGAFNASLIAKYAEKFMELIAIAEQGVTTRGDCYATLGAQLTKEPPPEKKRLKLLNDVWVEVAGIQDAKEYIPIAQVWLEFVVKFFKEREMSILLQDIWEHVGKEKYTPDLETYVEGILGILLYNIKDFHSLFQLDQVLPLIDLLQTSTKVEVAKGIMTRFTESGEIIKDAILINSLLDVSRTLHDSLTDFSIEDDRRQFAHVINTFISRVQYGRDFEGHLHFFVECRRSFQKLDAVIETAVFGVIALVTRALKVTQIKQHSKKGAAFIKACMAFCHITIPSLHDHMKRLKLLLLASMVALNAGFVTQCDIMMKTCMIILADVPAVVTLSNNQLCNTEDFVADFTHQLCASLVVMPGNPEDPFTVMEKLLDFITKEHQWDKNSVNKGKVLLSLFQCFCASWQEQLPYHFASGTSSNDTLYAGSKAYKDGIAKLCTQAFEEFVGVLAEIQGGAPAKAKQLASQALESVTAFADETSREKLKKAINKVCPSS
eukprot:TRINITY_DN8876_c0_g1_i1.p1 TRINITY_DN8876_c0_g1~~TRINITY_DN8876_c0_g1_i1.p1  ORF type:complete len:914 (+),score=151.54 TRINITY_DN8876_c0_g1_i1:31-2772(+)